MRKHIFEEYLDTEEEIKENEIDLGRVSSEIMKLATMWRTCVKERDALKKKFSIGKLNIARGELEKLKIATDQADALEHNVKMCLRAGFGLWGEHVELRKGFRAAWRLKKYPTD